MFLARLMLDWAKGEMTDKETCLEVWQWVVRTLSMEGSPVSDFAKIIAELKKLKASAKLLLSAEQVDAIENAIDALSSLTTPERADGFWLVDHEWLAVSNMHEAAEDRDGWLELQPYVLLDRVWVCRERQEEYINFTIRRTPPPNVPTSEFTVIHASLDSAPSSLS